MMLGVTERTDCTCNVLRYLGSHQLNNQTCKDLMKDLIKKEYSTYFGSDGRSETSSYGAEKFMLERKIFPFSIRSFWHHAKLALIVNIVGRLSMIFKGNILRV